MKSLLHHVIQGPIVTEKTASLQTQWNQVCLRVHPKANKPLIRQALLECLGVRAQAVRVCIRRGKSARVGRYVGRHANMKRALVTLQNAADVEKLGIDLTTLSQEKSSAPAASATAKRSENVS